MLQPHIAGLMIEQLVDGASLLLRIPKSLAFLGDAIWLMSSG